LKFFYEKGQNHSTSLHRRQRETTTEKKIKKIFSKKGKIGPLVYIGVRRVDKSFGNVGAAVAERNNCNIR